MWKATGAVLVIFAGFALRLFDVTYAAKIVLRDDSGLVDTFLYIFSSAAGFTGLATAMIVPAILYLFIRVAFMQDVLSGLKQFSDEINSSVRDIRTSVQTELAGIGKSISNATPEIAFDTAMNFVKRGDNTEDQNRSLGVAALSRCYSSGPDSYLEFIVDVALHRHLAGSAIWEEDKATQITISRPSGQEVAASLDLLKWHETRRVEAVAVNGKDYEWRSYIQVPIRPENIAALFPAIKYVLRQDGTQGNLFDLQTYVRTHGIQISQIVAGQAFEINNGSELLSISYDGILLEILFKKKIVLSSGRAIFTSIEDSYIHETETNYVLTSYRPAKKIRCVICP